MRQIINGEEGRKEWGGRRVQPGQKGWGGKGAETVGEDYLLKRSFGIAESQDGWKLRSSSFPPTSSSQKEASLHDRKLAPGPAATKDLFNTTPQGDGCWEKGVSFLLHSHPVVLLLTFVTWAP